MAAPEATITEYGVSNPAPAISYKIVNAFSYPGYLVKVHTTAGYMTGTSALTDLADGFTIKSCVPATMQAIAAYLGASDGAAQVAQDTGVHGLIPGQEYYIILAPTCAVAVGDMMGPTTTVGAIQPRTATGSLGSAGTVYFKALEAKLTQAGSTAGTTIKVRCTLPVYFAAGAGP